MSALVKRMKITTIRVTDTSGVEHEFEGEGTLTLRGAGTNVEDATAFIKLKGN